MCMLCCHLNGQSSGIADANGRFALNGLSIAPAELLDHGSVAITRRATATDGVLDYYLHKPGGAVTVSGGGFGEQEIQSVAIPESDQDYFNTVVRQLDSIIDLDFHQVEVASRADVDIFYDANIDLGVGGITLGLAVTTGAKDWELFLNFSELKNDEPYRRYALIHELGHALGLEHPFNAMDGDVFKGIEDPWSSAYPENTVMAYRSPKSETWPDFFTVNDLNALIEAWGAEPRHLSERDDILVGNDYRDVVLGDGGHDELRGLKRNDLLKGGLGDDRLFGGPGPDQLFGGSGDDLVFGGVGHDEIRPGSGDDRIRGGYGSDLFVIGSGFDVIEDFRISDHDRLGLRGSIQYSLAQVGGDLHLSFDLGKTVLSGIDITAFDPSVSIIDI